MSRMASATARSTVAGSAARRQVCFEDDDFSLFLLDQVWSVSFVNCSIESRRCLTSRADDLSGLCLLQSDGPSRLLDSPARLEHARSGAQARLSVRAHGVRHGRLTSSIRDNVDCYRGCCWRRRNDERLLPRRWRRRLSHHAWNGDPARHDVGRRRLLDTARSAGAPLVVRSVQERFARAEERRRRSALPPVASAADSSSAVTGTRRPVGDSVARVLPAPDDRRRNRREPEALERMSAARTSVERTAVAQHSRRSGRLRSSASR